jgi:trigger factor
MKVTQEILPDSQVGLEIEVTPEMSKQTYEQVLRKYMRTANIPGFRKGKVPRQVLIQRLGAQQMKAAVLEEVVQTAVEQAIKQEEIEAIGNYQLTSSIDDLLARFEPGNVLIFSASVDVPPRVSLSDYKSLSVKAEEIKPDPAKVDETLEEYRVNLATLVPIEDRPAQMGDVAVVDFVGKKVIEGEEPEAFPGGSAEDFQVEISEGRFIPGFVEGIVGMTLDETKDVSVTFPEEYGQEDLAGQPAVFTITLKELKEKELPELDDDFAQEVSEFETLAELRTSLEKRFQEQAADQTTQNTHEALIEALVANLTAEIPQTLVQKEVDFLVMQTAMQLSGQGIDINKLLTKELVDGMRQRSRPEAIARLQRTLALGEVAKQESITVEEDAIAERMAEIMSGVEDSTSIDQTRLREVSQEELLQEKILDWLKKQATIELVPEGSLAPEPEPEPGVDAAASTVDVAASDAAETEPESDSEPDSEAAEKA